MKRHGIPAIILLFCCILSGCTLIKLKKEVNESLESTIVTGRVATNFSVKYPIIVAACSINQGSIEIAHHTVLHDAGEYELLVGAGEYFIFAYCDTNCNFVYEPGELAGQYGDNKIVSVPAGGVVHQIDIVIPEKEGKIAVPPGCIITQTIPAKLHSRLAGAITNLDNEYFSEEYGSKGFWEPVEFYKTLGGNIYFLEEYDPQKIPILFIHGATGTPAGWKFFVDNLDRTRFQPWFFYYPSGARIKSMSYLLFWKLLNLQIKYKFDQIYITAHSMGGLVARSFLLDYGKFFPYTQLFISLATPWGGDKMAEYGVQQSPAVIPSWIDMQPEGEFIQSLYREKLNDSISFYMFSGHRGGRNPFQTNNDGTISLSSILDLRPQAEAKMNYTFNEDHASIIYSKDVLNQYNTIVNTYNNSTKSSKQAGGNIQINFSYNYHVDGTKPWPSLILRPCDTKRSETVIYLSDTDSGKILGPFPPGDYTVSIIAPASFPTTTNIPVTLASGTTEEVNFTLTPDGTLAGYVTAALQPEDRPVGMPAERYLPKDKKIKINALVLRGEGVHKTLHPLEDETINYTDLGISRTDFCHNGLFNFYGLPTGTYELVIHASGYQPKTESYVVTPGKQEEYKIMLLTPAQTPQ
ncbi:MAG: hypothetical protein BWK76_15285 [Desulfobulbaceae bacterium A2]|nr:MAG: hypothetical protein BWK76_15285 [Desulfobulbaceae bacterium A2]